MFNKKTGVLFTYIKDRLRASDATICCQQSAMCLAWVSVLIFSLPKSVFAQVRADDTLPNNSVITRNGNTFNINGGTKAGSNLFHSFEEFSVPDNGTASFNNAVNIQNIIGRVTGGEVSNINGLIKANGSANLFFINPNGIVFGENARLDIGGSFSATTANSLKFLDGSEFSAINPQASPLLTIDITPGLQYGTIQPGATIINTGSLRSQQDLTLVADEVYLQGELKAGRDLTLQAQDIVIARDSETNPFLVESGGNLSIQGNQGIDILTLNHSNRLSLVSGGNLSLISDGTIFGDAGFTSGGNFSAGSLSGEVTDFFSEYGSTISSNGNVDVAANYIGTSLLVESKGNIRFQGDVDIISPNISNLPAGKDTETLSNSTALIMRSGQENLAYESVDSGSVTALTSETVPEGITIGGNVVLQPFNGAGGIVNLLANSGDVNAGLISTNGEGKNPHSPWSNTQIPVFIGSYSPFNQINESKGGDIRLQANNGSITTGDLLSHSYSKTATAGNGGEINLLANNGSINTGNVNSFSRSEFEFSTPAKGGDISFQATNGNITTGNLLSYSYSEINSPGDGGKINLETDKGIKVDGNLESSSLNGRYSETITGKSGNAGAIRLKAGEDISVAYGITAEASSYSYVIAGNGGNIDLEAQKDILVGLGIYSGFSSNSGSPNLGSETNGGNGGAISILSHTGNIRASGVSSSSTNGVSDDDAGDGGTIKLQAPKGSIFSEGAIGSVSATPNGTGTAGNGGEIILEADDDITTNGNVDSYSRSGSGDARNGGAINITSSNGNITVGKIGSFSYSNNYLNGLSQRNANLGKGGAVSLRAEGTIKIEQIFSVGGLGSGNITIVSNAPFTFGDNSGKRPREISSNTFSSGRGGDIQITAPSISLINGNQISASAFGSGAGGNISLNATDFVEINGFGSRRNVTAILNTYRFAGNLTSSSPGDFIPTFTSTGSTGDIDKVQLPSGLFTQKTSNSTGTSGSLTIKTGRLSLNNRGAIATTTFGENNNAGDIFIQADSVSVDNGSILSGVAEDAKGNSGQINLEARSLELMNGGVILTSTLGNGNAGDITVNVEEMQLGKNSGLFAQTRSSANAGNLTVQPLNNGQNLLVNLEDGAQISASTDSSGQGGKLTVKAPESITIRGDGSIVSAETTGSGTGGDLIFDTGKLTVKDNAEVSVSSVGSGEAGDLRVDADSILLDNQGKIRADTTGGGGNISVNSPFIVLRRGSSITTNANGENISGGNINIDGKNGFIIAAPNQNSDIRADSENFRGGEVTISNIAGIYGIESRLEPSLPTNDITAKGASAELDGTVELDSPEVDPNSGLVELPNVPVDSEVAQGCYAPDVAQSSFVVTGRGGLPFNPKDILTADATQIDWVSVKPSNNNRSVPPVINKVNTSTPKRIVEAAGATLNDKGQIVLTANSSRLASGISRKNLIACEND